ncbi:MAG: TraR/DksA C4-type zinc finger protein [Chloroflexota bacterium]|nr:TraR/DksA C4-type zinc finger protein [Chloroflexota bacterium]
MADTDEKIDMGALKERLSELKMQLERDVATKDRQIAEDGDDLDPERGGVQNHMADDATETFEQEEMLGLQGTERRQLDAANEALARMEEGTYGTCRNCGKPIGAARLNAMPSSNLCIDCQQLQDAGRL